MAGVEQRKPPTKNKRGGRLSIPVKGGGGILIVGGALIALGATFLFRRLRANKRRLPPPSPPLPNQADEIHGKLANDAAKASGDPRIGLQSILLPPMHQESAVAAAEIGQTTAAEIGQTKVIEDVIKKMTAAEIGQTTVIEDVIKKIEFKEVEEKHDEEEHETLAMESEEDAPELSFDETGSSSVESSVAAVWPADMMDQEEESPAMEMKEMAETEVDFVPEVMKLKAMENLDAMPMTKVSEKNKHYKGFIILLALLVAFGLLCCRVAVFPKIQ